MQEATHATANDTYKQQDAASYDDVADRFEQYTEQFALPIARRLVAMGGLTRGARVLDVGCGTGVLSRIAARAVGDAGRITGLDLSDGMLRHAATLARREPSGNRITFMKGDAERLDLPDASFDAVISLYALRHFPDPQQALREMVRVGRPGSVAVVGVGSAPPFLSAAFFEAGLRVVFERLQGLSGRAPLHATAVIDGLLARHAAAEAPHHGTADAFGSLRGAMRDAGYRDLRSAWVGQRSVIATVEDFWGLQATLSTRARKLLPLLPASDALALRNEFDAHCQQQLRRGGKLVYRSGALIVAGRR